MNKKEKIALVALGILIDRFTINPSIKTFWFSVGFSVGFLLMWAAPYVKLFIEVIGK